MRYKKPAMEILELYMTDIICTSDGMGEDDDTHNEGDGDSTNFG